MVSVRAEAYAKYRSRRRPPVNLGKTLAPCRENPDPGGPEPTGRGGKALCRKALHQFVGRPLHVSRRSARRGTHDRVLWFRVESQPLQPIWTSRRGASGTPPSLHPPFAELLTGGGTRFAEIRALRPPPWPSLATGEVQEGTVLSPCSCASDRLYHRRCNPPNIPCRMLWPSSDRPTWPRERLREHAIRYGPAEKTKSAEAGQTHPALAPSGAPCRRVVEAFAARWRLC